MKPKILSFYLTTVIIMFFGTCVFGVPKYTDKQTALKMAKVLDKGTFGRYTISSTYVQNDNVSKYYISVILSDGSSQKWFISQIHKWSRDDKLQLSNNRALLFLDLRDTKFVVLDKNEFHKLALRSKVFTKEFGAGDLLRGKKFRFRIKNFSLISPTEAAFGRDDTGSKYRYIIDLFNGMRELLTYEDAFRIQEKEYLRIEPDPNFPTYERAYHVTKIVPYPKTPSVDGVSQFGIEIQFDQPIRLSGDQFPYEIFERKRYKRRTRKTEKEFTLDITIPNSEKKYEIRPIKNLEYLYNVKIVTDPQYPKRLLLRTSFNPMVMDIPPVIYKNGENSIYVNFFNLVDQTVLSRGMLLQAKKRRAAEQKSVKRIPIAKAVRIESDYDRAFVAAMEIHKQSQIVREPVARINKLLTGIRQFEEAALLAKKDAELFNALSKRNHLRESVIALTIDYVKSLLAKEDLGGANAENLIGLLGQAESFTRAKQVLKNIEELREKLDARR